MRDFYEAVWGGIITLDDVYELKPVEQIPDVESKAQREIFHFRKLGDKSAARCGAALPRVL